MSGKYALIIGNTEYTDLGLRQLNAPSRDAEDFSRVLKDKNLCEFDDVRVLLNQVSSAIIEAIDEFFDQKRPDDLLVLYFSGHGVRDELGSLYLAVKNTIRSRLRSTAIKSDYIRESMDQSRSKRQVLILDCCNSGAFPQGTKAELGGTMGMTQAFQGYGRLVLTASDATQFAWEGDKVIGKTDNSLFTHFLVKGLEGEADSNSDGRITVDELYDYAYEQISRVTPKQTPTKSASKQEGEIVLRQNIRIEDIKSAPLPAPLLDSIENPLSDIRLAAVQQLTKLLNGKNLGLARSARDALKRIAEEDDSRAVSRAAMQALEEVRQAELLTLQKEEDAERLATQKAEKAPPAQEKHPDKKIARPEQALEKQIRDAKVAPTNVQAKYTVRQDVKRQDGERLPSQQSVVKIPAKEGKYTKSSGLSFITAGGVIIGLVLFGFAVLRIAGGFRPAATEEPGIDVPATEQSAATPIKLELPPLAEVSKGWTMEGGNPSNSSWNAAENQLYPPLEKFWEWKSDALFCPEYPTYSGGIVYLNGTHNNEDNAVYAIRIGENQPLWIYRMLEAGNANGVPVTIGDGLVYFGSDNQVKNTGELFIANALNGDIVRVISGIGSYFYNTPLKLDNDMVFSTVDPFMAIDARTGEKLWEVDQGGEIRSSNALAGSLLIAGKTLDYDSINIDIIAFDQRTGTVLWQTNEPRGHEVVTDNQRVYAVVSSVYDPERLDSVAAYNLVDGTEAWRRNLGFNLEFWARIAVTDERLFVAGGQRESQDRTLYAFETRTGNLLKEIKLSGVSYIGDLVVANGVLYVGTGTDLQAYDASTLVLLWTEEGTANSLAVSDGLLLVSACWDGIRAYR